ncbi:MAG: hypothetical protein ABIE74_07065 [Pseudomonadota bacterium]
MQGIIGVWVDEGWKNIGKLKYRVGNKIHRLVFLLWMIIDMLMLLSKIDSDFEWRKNAKRFNRKYPV